MTDLLEGWLACGAVRYRLDSAPMFVHCCHCSDFLVFTADGSAFVLNAYIEASDRGRGGRRAISMPSACRPIAVSPIGSIVAPAAKRRCGANMADAPPSASSASAPWTTRPLLHRTCTSMSARSWPWVTLPRRGSRRLTPITTSKKLWPAAGLERRRAILG